MNTVIFSGYIAEVIALRAERKNTTPAAYVLSFFDKRCNAPESEETQTKPRISLRREVQCTAQ